MSDTGSATERYKEMTAWATSAAKRLQRHETEKAAALEDRVATANERIAHAEAEHERVCEAVEFRWHEAMAELFHERWMRVTPMPEPSKSAAPAQADEAIRFVQSAYLGLREALGRSRPWIPRRRPKED